MGMMFFSNILDLRVDFFVLRRSLQFCGLLMLSIRLSNAGSLRRDARRLSTSDETFSCKGRSVSSSSVTSLTSSASWAQEDAFKSSLFPFLARGSVGLSSAAVYSPSPSEEFNKSFSSSCAGSYAAFNFLATGLTLESRLVAWSILWLSSSRSNSPVFLVCPGTGRSGCTSNRCFCGGASLNVPRRTMWAFPLIWSYNLCITQLRRGRVLLLGCL